MLALQIASISQHFFKINNNYPFKALQMLVQSLQLVVSELQPQVQGLQLPVRELQLRV